MRHLLGQAQGPGAAAHRAPYRPGALSRRRYGRNTQAGDSHRRWPGSTSRRWPTRPGRAIPGPAGSGEATISQLTDHFTITQQAISSTSRSWAVALLRSAPPSPGFSGLEPSNWTPPPNGSAATGEWATRFDRLDDHLTALGQPPAGRKANGNKQENDAGDNTGEMATANPAALKACSASPTKPEHLTHLRRTGGTTADRQDHRQYRGRGVRDDHDRRRWRRRVHRRAVPGGGAARQAGGPSPMSRRHDPRSRSPIWCSRRTEDHHHRGEPLRCSAAPEAGRASVSLDRADAYVTAVSPGRR